MSGIVAVLRTDGAPIEGAMVEALANSMRQRGPDAQHTWTDGSVGLGHALLQTTFDVEHDRQPLSLDGAVYIVADGRVDERSALIRGLHPGCGVTEHSSDAELILRAYLQWGSDCTSHLLGDFSFVIWDGRRRRLFCGRDHMGIKPCYYAHVGPWLLISSTIETIRVHPEVSSELNDLAIADFLMFGFNCEHATTSFRDVKRLPPAHTLTWSEGHLKVERYWTLPIEEPVYHRRDSDYIDEFKGAVQQAVTDRLRVPRVGVFMSGGLDSPMLAATARAALRHGPISDPVHSYTFVYQSLFVDPEREHASAVADHLGVPIHHYALDEDVRWSPTLGAELAEPSLALMNRTPSLRCYRDIAHQSPVAFFGEGPDNALAYEWQPHLARLWRARRFTRLVRDVTKHLIRHKRVPLLPTIPRMLKRTLGPTPDSSTFPQWLEPSLVNRLGLRERWRATGAVSGAVHPWRPRGYASLLSAQWQRVFETLEPAFTRAPLEVRHPYLDLRVLQCMLRMPALPWCRTKHLVREALRGIVSERARRRRKAPLAGDPIREQVRRIGLPAAGGSHLVRRYCNEDAGLSFIALSHWLDRNTSTMGNRSERTNELESAARI